MRLSISGKELGDGAPAYVIAEIGVNHAGDPQVAKSLILAAKSAGADCAKFQAFHAKDLVGEESDKFGLLSHLELSAESLRELKEFCDSIGIQFLASVFDRESLKYVLSLGVPAVKIPSGEIVNENLLTAAAKSGLAIFISTGMSLIDEVKSAASLLSDFGALKRTVFLHCVSAYPAPVSQLNLRAIPAMRNLLKTLVGISDHTTSVITPAAAVSLGACVVEKHLTFSRTAEGPDHPASLTPDEFSLMVRYIREVESALGDGRKRLMDCEQILRTSSRRGVYAARDIGAGEIIKETDITLRRPDITGVRIRDIAGKPALHKIQKGEPITRSSVGTASLR
jgi:sialic acid synthase SpsE